MDKEDKVVDIKEEEILEEAQEQQKYEKEDNKINNNEEWKVVEETQSKGSNLLKGIGMIVAIVVILGGMAWSGMKLHDLTQSPSYNKPQGNGNQATEGDAETPNKGEENIDQVALDEESLEEINNYVHHMANTIIIAVDGKINGIEKITMESIDKALGLVQGVDEYLYNEINKWKEGDFSNGVDVHNYVWKELDGEIGKANSLDEAAIDAVKANLGL